MTETTEKKFETLEQEMQKLAREHEPTRVAGLLAICSLPLENFLKMARAIPPHALYAEDISAARRSEPALKNPQINKRLTAIATLLKDEEGFASLLDGDHPVDAEEVGLLQTGKVSELSDAERQYIYDAFPTPEGRPYKQALLGPGDDIALGIELLSLTGFAKLLYGNAHRICNRI